MENFQKNDAADDALPAGTSLCERYVLGKVIGSGGFGITYLAYDTIDGKKIAVKEYYPKGVAVRSPDGYTIEPITSLHKSDFQKGMDSFINESEILSRLNGNTDVINVYDTFEQNGTAYYAMEYINGITLKEYVRRYGKTSEGQALYAAVKISSAFEHIHKKNIIHRDLSPNNIMIDIDGSVKLVDFGNARPFSYEDDNSMTVKLKPGYAPLEQYQHYGKHGPWTDIYSLGAVMYYMLTANDPRDPMTRFNNDSEFCNALSGISAQLAAVIKKMTAIKIEDRYTQSAELLSDLNSVPIPKQSFCYYENE